MFALLVWLAPADLPLVTYPVSEVDGDISLYDAKEERVIVLNPTASDVWRLADDLPVFESGWTFDHLYPLFGDSTEDCFEGWITLTALLHETSRLRGGRDSRTARRTR